MKLCTRLALALLLLLSISCGKNEPAPVPSITGFKPASAPIGGTVTISGFNFSPKPVENQIKVNGKNQFATSATATSLVISILPGTTSGPITVTVGGQTATSSKDFIVACLLQTYVRITSTSSQTIAYSYNNDYQLSRIDVTGTSGNYYSEYIYDNSGKLIQRTTVEGTVSTVTYFEYDADDRLILALSGSNSTTYSYNATDQVTLVTYSPTSSSTLEYPNTTTRNYSKEVYTNGTTSTTYTYEYDNKFNPFQIIFRSFPTQTDNNLIRQTSGTSVFEYALTYNALGFPLTVTGSGSSTLTATLSYDCD